MDKVKKIIKSDHIGSREESRWLAQRIIRFWSTRHKKSEITPIQKIDRSLKEIRDVLPFDAGCSSILSS